MKILCKLIGGSFLYDLENENSDVDIRGVYAHSDIAKIIGTTRGLSSPQKIDNKTDVIMRDLVHYCVLLQKNNMEAIELLFCDSERFSKLTSEFCYFRDHRNHLVDSVNMFKSFRGYSLSEYNQAVGQTKSKLGSQRKILVERYGYSPKNAVNMLRLTQMGITFFETDKFIVHGKQFEKSFYELLLRIKNQPQTFTFSEFAAIAAQKRQQLETAFKNRKVTHSLDEQLLNDIIHKIYLPILGQA